MSEINVTTIKNENGDYGPSLVGHSTVTGDLTVTGTINVTTLGPDVSIAGSVTANKFYGDGAELQNLPESAGLGTVLSDDKTSPLNKIYYTDQVLSVGSTITIDPPNSSQVAYTQYSQIVLNDDADLIVSAGDDFIPDILGIGTTGVGSGTLTGDGGRIRADNLTNRAGTGAPTANNGLVVTGVVTATSGSFSGNVSIGGHIDLIDDSKIRVGTDDDLQIYANGSDSFIQNSKGDMLIRNTGDDIIIRATDDVHIEVQGGENSIICIGNGAVKLHHNNDQKLETTSTGVTVTGTVSDSKGELRKLIPNTQSGTYTLVAGDSGKYIWASNTVTVPNNVLSAGDMVTIVNNTNGNLTITNSLSVMYMSSDGTSAASRTLSAYGMATILFVSGTAAYISGAGLS